MDTIQITREQLRAGAAPELLDNREATKPITADKARARREEWAEYVASVPFSKIKVIQGPAGGTLRQDLKVEDMVVFVGTIKWRKNFRVNDLSTYPTKYSALCDHDYGFMIMKGVSTNTMHTLYYMDSTSNGVFEGRMPIGPPFMLRVGNLFVFGTCGGFLSLVGSLWQQDLELLKECRLKEIPGPKLSDALHLSSDPRLAKVVGGEIPCDIKERAEWREDRRGHLEKRLGMNPNDKMAEILLESIRVEPASFTKAKSPPPSASIPLAKRKPSEESEAQPPAKRAQQTSGDVTAQTLTQLGPREIEITDNWTMKDFIAEEKDRLSNQARKAEETKQAAIQAAQAEHLFTEGTKLGPNFRYTFNAAILLEQAKEMIEFPNIALRLLNETGAWLRKVHVPQDVDSKLADGITEGLNQAPELDLNQTVEDTFNVRFIRKAMDQLHPKSSDNADTPRNEAVLDTNDVESTRANASCNKLPNADDPIDKVPNDKRPIANLTDDPVDKVPNENRAIDNFADDSDRSKNKLPENNLAIDPVDKVPNENRAIDNFADNSDRPQNKLPDNNLAIETLPEDSLAIETLPDDDLAIETLPDDDLAIETLPDDDLPTHIDQAPDLMKILSDDLDELSTRHIDVAENIQSETPALTDNNKEATSQPAKAAQDAMESNDMQSVAQYADWPEEWGDPNVRLLTFCPFRGLTRRALTFGYVDTLGRHISLDKVILWDPLTCEDPPMPDDENSYAYVDGAGRFVTHRGRVRDASALTEQDKRKISNSESIEYVYGNSVPAYSHSDRYRCKKHGGDPWERNYLNDGESFPWYVKQFCQGMETTWSTGSDWNTDDPDTSDDEVTKMHKEEEEARRRDSKKRDDKPLNTRRSTRTKNKKSRA